MQALAEFSFQCRLGNGLDISLILMGEHGHDTPCDGPWSSLLTDFMSYSYAVIVAEVKCYLGSGFDSLLSTGELMADSKNITRTPITLKICKNWSPTGV